MSEEFPSSWVIDVCRYCGAHAVWPFRCGHRVFSEAGKPWCAPVLVTGRLSSASRLPLPADTRAR